MSTYQTIDIDAPSNRLTYRAWTEDGRVLDELVIEKAREQRLAKLPLAERRS